MNQTKLAERVKPELNHIYTERPFEVQSGLDLGWFCREHALHLYGLAKLLGAETEICVGDFIVRKAGGNIFSSVRDQSDHAWCRVDGVDPVDVSLTLKHIFPNLQDVRLIYGDNAELASPALVRYFEDIADDVFLDSGRDIDLFIGYNEKNRHSFDLIDLLENPFQFLFGPPPGIRNFADLHGDDVFFAITFHCYRLMTEEINPLFRHYNSLESVRRIMRYNPDAKERITHLLS